MADFHFRLQPLLEQKLRRKEDAEREMAKRQKDLWAEQDSLSALQRELGNLGQQVVAARQELLHSEHTSGLSLIGHSEYLSTLELEVDAARDVMFAQELAVEKAGARLEQAREQLANCSREAEILIQYKDKLQQRFIQAAAQREEIEEDEIGSVLYRSRSRR